MATTPGPNHYDPRVLKYCVETRNHETGELTLQGDQPPFLEATSEQLVAHFLNNVADDGRTSVSWAEIGEWYAAKGWFWRPKTW